MGTRLLVLFLLGPLLAGCGLSTEPDPPRLYELVAMGESPLPRTIDASVAGTIEVVEGRIHLDARDTYRKELVLRRTGRTGVPEIIRDVQTGPFAHSTDVVALYLEGQVAEELEITDGGRELRTVRAYHTGPGVGIFRVYVYRRVD